MAMLSSMPVITLTTVIAALSGILFYPSEALLGNTRGEIERSRQLTPDGLTPLFTEPALIRTSDRFVYTEMHITE